jgi:Domain of unknown function (DUF1918)
MPRGWSAAQTTTMAEKSHVSGDEPRRAKAGDWMVVHGHAVGQPERRGLILEVLGEPGHEHYRVRWDEEHESIFYPGSDATIRREANA